ncbi:MAG TPA: 5-deoxy-glucuronate isomerase [Streptosporangiaceae bacterium]|nr:5-deoxy-glucuronate isomerase [Streptosporangiaceae bacterium]
MTRYHVPAGTSAAGIFELELTPATNGWTYCSLRILGLRPGEQASFSTGPEEMLVLPLTGGCTVSAAGTTLGLAGRSSVFSRLSDFAYLPRDSAVTISSAGGGRFALPGALAARRLPVRYGPADQIPVELRGTGQTSRQVCNFCAPEVFDCDKLVAVEVLTPAGNWSSFPPHKHDRAGDGEAELEEIYYFEIDERERGAGMAYQRVYSSAPDRQIDVLAEVRSGDTVLVPHGYHGPSMAAPGHHLYYLNVLAGPAERRSMAFSFDPAHAWIRDALSSQPLDPRLPLTSAEPGKPA